MPRRSTHLWVGVLASVSVSLLAHGPEDPDEARWWRGLGATGGGALGSVLPDVLEPSTKFGPNHRGMMHSIALAVLGGRLDWRAGLRQLRDSGLAAYRRSQDLTISPEARASSLTDARWGWVLQGALLGFGVGYGSHLLLDGATPKSLPIVGLKLSA
jgi:hypothetical protein